MPLYNLFPNLPTSLPELLLAVAGVLGALTLSYAVLLEAERSQDAVFVLASASLLAYALIEGNRIFIFAFALLLMVSGRELIQIMRGKHHHTEEDIKKYDHPESK